MGKRIAAVLERAAPTLAEDALGCLALVALLMTGLHFPGLP